MEIGKELTDIKLNSVESIVLNRVFNPRPSQVYIKMDTDQFIGAIRRATEDDHEEWREERSDKHISPDHIKEVCLKMLEDIKQIKTECVRIAF